MVTEGASIAAGHSSGHDTLYHAAKEGRTEDVKSLLASLESLDDVLNLADPENGWTPLFVACANGHLDVAKLLLEAGADHNVQDAAGWTAKEYAAFNGRLWAAKSIEDFETSRFGKSERENDVNIKRLYLKEALGHPVGWESRGSSYPEKPMSLYRSDNKYTQVFVTVGPSNTRSSAKAFEPLEGQIDGNIKSSQATSGYLFVQGQDAGNLVTQRASLPVPVGAVNQPFRYRTEDPDLYSLKFEVAIAGPGDERKSIGAGVALLSNLRHGTEPLHENLVRDCRVPIVEPETMNIAGFLTISVLIVTPYDPSCKPPLLSAGLWEEDGATPIVGHRGSGANAVVPKSLEIGENTVQSFLTAKSLGACCVEFDVQLTKDSVPVIWHDFVVTQTGGDVPLHTLDHSQFLQHIDPQATRAILLNSAETRYTDRAYPSSTTRPRPRSHSLETYDNRPHESTVARMRNTYHNSIMGTHGNIRTLSIHEPSTTLPSLLTQLPEELPFNIEIKHPMLWETEDRHIPPYAPEVNHVVDTILNTTFSNYKNRNITFSSFSPDICILLAIKQSTFPVMFLTKGGVVPVGDQRAASLEEAVAFANAWDLAGVVVLGNVLTLAPRLIQWVKRQGLRVASYGNVNDEPENARMQVEAGIDAIITNKVKLISNAVRGEKA